MMNFKIIPVVLGYFLLAQSGFSQSESFVDSVKNSIRKIPETSEKIRRLHPIIQGIYLTQFEATIELANWGYDMAREAGDKGFEAEFLRFVGNAYGKKGNIDSATVYYYRALPILEGGGNQAKLGLLYDDLARLYRKLRQPQRALEFYEKALRLYESENDLEGIARINNESGVVYRDEGDYETANQRFEKSLRIQRERNDSVGIGYALEFLGNNQMLIKDYKKAESYLMQALKIRELLKDDFALMLNYTALGEYYQATKQYQRSNGFFQKSNTVARKISFADIQKYNFQQLTSNYEALQDYKQAYMNQLAYQALNDSLYSTRRLKDVEEITTKYETAEKEMKILAQKSQIAENNLRLKKRDFWIFGLSLLLVIIALLAFLYNKNQSLRNQRKLQEQRNLIARDLHDNIGSQLSFIISAIDSSRYYLPAGESMLTGKLENIGKFARETIQELRDTIWAMNKSEVTIRDLQSRLANFIEKAKQSQQSAAISLWIADSVPTNLVFSGLEGLNIFRIIQEATNNALKYADASEILIQVEIRDQALQFRIQDNGKGFSEADITPGNGLYNMRKRAQELGSELVLMSGPGKGTSIHFSFKK